MRLALGIAWLACGCGRVDFDPLHSNDAGSGGGDGGDSGGSANTATYVATIAECINPNMPDPAFCRTTNGNTELPVDLDDNNLHVPFYSYLRFDFDQAISGRTVTNVVLRAVITDGAQSNGPSTGEI